MRGLILFTLFLFILGLSACSTQQTTQQVKAVNKSKIKNVIFMIGDGMGPQQVGLLLSYARQAPNAVIPRLTAFDHLVNDGRIGVSLPYTHNVLVTDSAASATQLASGSLAGNEMTGVDYKDNKTHTILEIAKEQGKAVGLVSDTRLTHATPAGFAAHQRHRSMENEIAIDMLNSDSDVLLSGGWRHWIPKNANIAGSPEQLALQKLMPHAKKIKSKRKDNRNLLLEAKAKGYSLAFDRETLNQATGKVLGLFAYSGMANGIIETQTKNDPNRTMPTLKEMTVKSIDTLSKNPNGFFLMVESGQIDWAGHQNDAGWMLHEMLKMNETLSAVLEWMKGRDDTLLVVTADHETGGFGFSYSGFNLPKAKKLSGEMFKEALFKPNYNFGDPAILDKLYQQKLVYSAIFKKYNKLAEAKRTPRALVELVNKNTEFPINETEAKRILETESNLYYEDGHYSLGKKIVSRIGANDAYYVYAKRHQGALLARVKANDMGLTWSTGTHTSTPVLVFSKGPGTSTEPFTKIIHHTDIPKYIDKAMSDN